MKFQSWWLYARAGYEADLAAELEQYSADYQVFGYCKFVPKSTLVHFSSYQPCEQSALQYKHLIFARQLVAKLGEISFDNQQDRVAAILSFLDEQIPTNEQLLFGDLFIEYADTEEGRQIAKFCQKFTVPLRQALRAKAWQTKAANNKLAYLHLYFEHSGRCLVGCSFPGNRSQHLLGIQRLKFPHDAPSRSTLKLDEAIQTFLKPSLQKLLFSAGMTAVDLGACPGGWTYQLAARGLSVEAVDNGKMDPALMATGKVHYAAADGFKYRPRDGHVDWLVCDMIEKPQQVADLVQKWLVNYWATSCIINLKLPMKHRYRTLAEILQTFRHSLGQESEYQLFAKHLYHDRDEITFMVIRGPHLLSYKAK